MYYLIITCIAVFISIPVIAQTVDYVKMSIEFKPPLDRNILDRLQQDETDTWVKFIRVNYILYLDGLEIDPQDLKQKMYIDNRVKNKIVIERRKK